MAVLSAPPIPQAIPRFFHKNSSSSPTLPISPRRSFLPVLLLSKPNARLLRRCPTAFSPQSEPPPGNDPTRHKDPVARFSRLQDHVRIFFAVFFWMSLFFWASAWDRKNNGSGRSNKGSRFRR